MKKKPGPKPKPASEKSVRLHGVSVPAEMAKWLKEDEKSPSAVIQRLIRESPDYQNRKRRS